MDSTERRLVDAYVFGYPLVVNLSTLRMLSEHGLGSLAAAGVNRFEFAPALATPDDAFARADHDTVRFVAVLDLSGGPLRLGVPDTDDAYSVLQFVDAWTNTFAYVGRRATGTRAGEYVIAPPGWARGAGEATVIRAPTDVAVIVGRIAVDGPDDMARVRALQTGFSLERLEPDRALRGMPETSAELPEHLRFWDLLRRWSAAFPPATADREYLRQFEPWGLVDPHDPYGIVSRELDEHLAHAVSAGLGRVEELAHETSDEAVNGWIAAPHAFDYNVDRLGLGTIDAPEWKIADREASYLARARSARNALWGSHGYEAYSAEAFIDREGVELDGSQAYGLRLADPPPADAFWSITMYDAEQFHLVGNPIERHSVGDRTAGLRPAADRSLVIRMQHEQPIDADAAANWLPTPPGRFRPVLRVYQPRAAVLDGTWAMPPIERLR